MKKNPFASAIRILEFYILENTVCVKYWPRLDDAGLYNYRVAKKTIHISKEPKSTFGVLKGSQNMDSRTVETNNMLG